MKLLWVTDNHVLSSSGISHLCLAEAAVLGRLIFSGFPGHSSSEIFFGGGIQVCFWFSRFPDRSRCAVFPARLMTSKTQMLCHVVDPTILVNAGLTTSAHQPPERLDRSPTAHICLGNPQQISSSAGSWQSGGKHQVWHLCSHA